MHMGAKAISFRAHVLLNSPIYQYLAPNGATTLAPRFR